MLYNYLSFKGPLLSLTSKGDNVIMRSVRPIETTRASFKGQQINLKGIKMKTVTLGKTIKTATRNVIAFDYMAQGVHKDYLVLVLNIISKDGLTTAHKKEINEALVSFTAEETYITEALRVDDKDAKASRRYKNIKNGLNNAIKYHKDVSKVDTNTTLLNIISSLVALNPKAKETPKKVTKTKAPVETVVDVKDAIETIKNETVNHQRELVQLGRDELTDNILELLIQVDNMDLTKQSVERLAVIQSHLEKVIG